MSHTLLDLSRRSPRKDLSAVWVHLAIHFTSRIFYDIHHSKVLHTVSTVDAISKVNSLKPLQTRYHTCRHRFRLTFPFTFLPVLCCSCSPVPLWPLQQTKALGMRDGFQKPFFQLSSAWVFREQKDIETCVRGRKPARERRQLQWVHCNVA